MEICFKSWAEGLRPQVKMEKKAFLRIDDFPYSGEMYAKYGEFRDTWMLRRLRKIVKACKENNVIPEVMVSSHAVERNGTFIRFDKVMPKTIRAMKEYLDRGLININAHGMIHLRLDKYLHGGEIDSKEFIGLSEEDTRMHIEENIKFIKEVFGKTSKGFVAPAWGYEPGITKKIASEYFDYIADSYDNWREGKCDDFGKKDQQYGFIHFPETWRYGKYSLERTNRDTWEKTWDEIGRIHFMQHGYRIPGEWKKILKSMSLSQIIKMPFKANLTSVLKAGQRAGALWKTLEEEARYILENH